MLLFRLVYLFFSASSNLTALVTDYFIDSDLTYDTWNKFLENMIIKKCITWVSSSQQDFYL